MKRRDFVRSNLLALTGGTVATSAAAKVADVPEVAKNAPRGVLPPEVQMQFMRPASSKPRVASSPPSTCRSD